MTKKIKVGDWVEFTDALYNSTLRQVLMRYAPYKIKAIGGGLATLYIDADIQQDLAIALKPFSTPFAKDGLASLAYIQLVTTPIKSKFEKYYDEKFKINEIKDRRLGNNNT
jgi:hypothetical protein